MQTLTATYRIVTPLFLGGANPDDLAELRVPPIKAALRFWWRSVKWQRIRSQFVDKGQARAELDKQAVAELYKQEALLFGSASGGQSPVLLRIRPVDMNARKKGEVLDGLANPDRRPGARYLGYGVMGAQTGQLTRSCIIHHAEFTLEMMARGSISQEIIDALKLLGLVGGLGSKARKGYGSLTLTSLDGNGVNNWHVPASAGAYIEEVRTLLSPTSTLTDEPPFSAFSGLSRVCLLLERNDPLSVLDDYGKQMQRYRSWGFTPNGQPIVNQRPSEKNFQDDHDWYYNRPPHAKFHPRRVIFGLPHNYSGKKGVKGVTPNEHDRRASPLWFHVHDYGQGKNRYAGLATVLRAQFLPDREQIKAGGKPVPADPKYSVITDFLTGAGRPAGSKDPPTRYFPDAKRVFP